MVARLREANEKRNESMKKEKVNLSERKSGEGRKGQKDREGWSRKGVSEHV